MPEQNTPKPEDVEIAVVQYVEDFTGLFNCAAKAFGEQIHDEMYVAPRRPSPPPSPRYAHLS